METSPVLEIYVCGYFPAEKKLQEQQTAAFWCKNKNKAWKKHTLHLCLLTQV